MPTWGIHLLTARKVNKRLNIKDYNSFLIGNIITDINNGYVIPNISKVIAHKNTHYYSEEETGKIIFYDVERFVKDNNKNLENPLVLGYITHLLTDSYWNALTYEKHGVYDKNNKLIGLKLNNGKNLIVDGEERRKTKTNDFKIFTNYIYVNNLVDIPKYEEKVYDMSRKIKCIDLTKKDIEETINYLDMAKKGIPLLKKEYEIFTEQEMLENVDKCVEGIIEYFNNII